MEQAVYGFKYLYFHAETIFGVSGVGKWGWGDFVFQPS
jgi:hypothetical protein